MEYKNRLLVLLLISLVAKSAISDESGHSNITTGESSNPLFRGRVWLFLNIRRSPDFQHTVVSYYIPHFYLLHNMAIIIKVSLMLPF